MTTGRKRQIGKAAAGYSPRQASDSGPCATFVPVGDISAVRRSGGDSGAILEGVTMAIVIDSPRFGTVADRPAIGCESDPLSEVRTLRAALEICRESLAGIRADFIGAIGYDPHADANSVWQEAIEDVDRAAAIADIALAAK